MGPLVLMRNKTFVRLNSGTASPDGVVILKPEAPALNCSRKSQETAFPRAGWSLQACKGRFLWVNPHIKGQG